MKTKLPQSINTIDEAKAFLMELYNNEEDFVDPAINALLLGKDMFTIDEAESINRLMYQIYTLPENLGRVRALDPAKYWLELETALSEKS